MLALAQAEDSSFSPVYENCERHGDWQQSFMDNGNARFLPRCPCCHRDEKIGQIMGRAGVPPRFVDKRLDNYTATLIGQIDALEVATAYANDFDAVLKTGRSLLFCGYSGTGKTHLAAGILNYLLSAGNSGVFSTVISAVRQVKVTWGKAAELTEQQAINKFVIPDLLVLDEVGVQFGTDTEKNILFEIINGRYENTRPTILISNLDIGGIEAYLGPRVIDRLRENEGRVSLFDWQSHRRAP